MREEIGFEIVDIRNFDSLVTLTLTFDDLETYISFDSSHRPLSIPLLTVWLQ